MAEFGSTDAQFPRLCCSSENQLAFVPRRSDPCPEAALTAKGEDTMTSTTETAPVSGAEGPQATNKARVAPLDTHVARKKGKSAKKATHPRGASKGTKMPAGPRDRSKTAKVLDLLKRPCGASATELMKATGWQPHSLRGFLSGTLGKKMGLTVKSIKGAEGMRSYSVKT
jgi:Protein of unknown function (DUF3489)